jgi:ABC-type dipeptide/oligopeptide/nickel transport system permease component
MFRFIIRRLLLGLLTLWLVSTTVFVMAYWVPNDPATAIAGKRATLEVVKRIHHDLGLDRPLIVQYGDYMWHLLRFDLGKSYVSGGGEPVWSLISSSLPITLWLVGGAGIIWFTLGVLSGVVSAVRARSLLDRGLTVLVLIGISIPPAVLYLLLMWGFFSGLRSQNINLFEVGPAGSPFDDLPGFISHMLLPWFGLAFLLMATYTRLTRSSMLEVMGEDFMRTAKAKGLSERRIILRHGLRAALTPVITQFGVDIGSLVGGVLVTEHVFGLQGVGQAAVLALEVGDTPTVIGVALFVAVFVVLANLVVDVLYAFLDPRVRLA